MTKTIIGCGRLSWDKGERVTDRYGFVYLLSDGDSTTPTSRYAGMAVDPADIGKLVTITAKVLETRQSAHIGDLFHGVYPKTPKVGEEIILGSGFLTEGRNCIGHFQVGVTPTDGRDSLFFNIRALYRAHEQTVELSYEVQKHD